MQVLLRSGLLAVVVVRLQEWLSPGDFDTVETGLLCIGAICRPAGAAPSHLRSIVPAASTRRAYENLCENICMSKRLLMKCIIPYST